MLTCISSGEDVFGPLIEKHLLANKHLVPLLDATDCSRHDLIINHADVIPSDWTWFQMVTDKS